MVWVRGLFPKENRGQFEGIRSLFFTLIPMFIGTLTGGIIIKYTPQPVEVHDQYGHIIDVPQENLFLYSALMVLLTIIPLIFAWREFDKELKFNK